MSDLIGGYPWGHGKFAILIEISGKATKSDLENLFAEIRRAAHRVGLSAKVVWPKKGKKGRKKGKKK